MNKICKNCQYRRVPGTTLDKDIPGEGRWCSNSKSRRFRTRVADDESCKDFYGRGKAPWWMRAANRVLRKLHGGEDW